jgi:hypothetical protein
MNDGSVTLPSACLPGMTLRYRRTGDLMMVVGATVAVIAALVAYPYAGDFSMGAQIVGHLLIPIGAAAFKLGYVVRLAAQEAQRRRENSATGARSGTQTRYAGTAA